jgi:PAS domain S-box-containing protein
MVKSVILCVDDEKGILDSLEEQLYSEFGQEFVIELAESGEEGLELLEEWLERGAEIPVVLADYLMPGMKGDQFLIRIHERLPESRTIMLTGQAGLTAITATINRANLYRYIAKPWEKNDLLLTIREAVASFRQNRTILAQNADLQALNQRLLKLNKELEERVAERTQNLDRQKALFRQVFDNSPDGMVIVDSGATVLEANPVFEEMFQISSAAIKGRPLIEINVPDEAREESLRILETILSGRPARLETRRRKNDGSFFPVSVVAYPIAIEKGQSGGILVYRDLSAQRETEALLYRSYERRLRRDFFTDLLSDRKGNSKEILEHAQGLGINLAQPFSMYFLAITGGTDSLSYHGSDQDTGFRMMIDALIDRIAAQSGTYAWDAQKGIGIIQHRPDSFSGDIQEEIRCAEELLNKIGSDFPEIVMAIGIAEFRPELARFAERYRQARISCLIGSKIHRNRRAHHYCEIGAFPILAALTPAEESERYLERTIGKILQYDRENGTDLFRTLDKIFASDNLRAVADEMYLHYKTILFRKQSIEKILGVPLDSFEGRTMIGTAMTLYYLREISDEL